MQRRSSPTRRSRRHSSPGGFHDEGRPQASRRLTGISGILVTPFDGQDRVAPARLKPIIDRAVGAGVHILVANGNTGEFYGLTTAEAETMVHAVAEQIAGRVPLLAGVGRSIDDACALARASRAAGAPALMVHQPPDPFVSPRGVVAYVQRIAEAGGGLPLMLYLRNDGIGLDAIEQLCRVPGRRRREMGMRRRRCGWRRRSAAATPRSSGSAASPRPGRRRSAPSARAASPPA